MIPKNVQNVLIRQRYKIVGNHSAAKLCLWTKKSIKTGGKEHCYKEKFYKDIGIKSHRCLQCTPAVMWCSLRCQFCWRAIEITLGQKIEKEDEPELIIEGLINAQKQLLSGLGGVTVQIGRVWTHSYRGDGYGKTCCCYKQWRTT